MGWREEIQSKDVMKKPSVTELRKREVCTRVTKLFGQTWKKRPQRIIGSDKVKQDFIHFFWCLGWKDGFMLAQSIKSFGSSENRTRFHLHTRRGSKIGRRQIRRTSSDSQVTSEGKGGGSKGWKGWVGREMLLVRLPSGRKSPLRSGVLPGP
jgi:hypothetical protein